MSAGCVGSVRSSPCSASGGLNAPGSCCASCARREKEGAGQGLEAREGPGGRASRRLARGPGGFGEEDTTGCRDGSVSWATGRGREGSRMK